MANISKVSLQVSNARGALTSILIVIPGRDLRTMGRLGYYYIIFASRTSAQVYLDNAVRAHKAAQQHTQSSFASAIPPPPGYLVHGEDVDALTKSFCLLPTTQDLHMGIMNPPYSPSFKQMMAKGQFLSLADVTHKHKVLLSIDSDGQLTSEIQGYLHLLGKERGLAYELVEADDAIKRLELRKAQSASTSEAQMQRVDAAETDVDNDSGYTPEADANLEARDYDAQENDQGEMISPKWIISFVSEAEAKRFTRASHGRRFPIFAKGALPHEQPGRMTAEYLW